MTDFLAFRRMLTPRLLIWAWYAVALASMIVGWMAWLGGDLLTGLAIMAGGTLGARVLCEVLLVTFAIHERLTDLLHVEERRETLLRATLDRDEALMP